MENELDTFLVCKEHIALVYQNTKGQLVCWDGREIIEDPDQVMFTIGRIIQCQIKELLGYDEEERDPPSTFIAFPHITYLFHD